MKYLSPLALLRPTLIALAITAASTPVAWAIDAFPGAEGAGRNAVGGRGGDVYFVTNLTDAGPGSLRWGVDTATGPRTILFNVAGTIHLQDSLKVKKSFLTIAGQSAPGGGITIADQQFGVSECHDVILQYVRARLGDDAASRAINPAPDALNVGTVQNVMIDHVTASWSIDEGLPVTHESNNVTVQYSFITEALRNAGHPSGNHSYATGIDHGDITFSHNLLANNDSRNPRVGDLARLDFVNNVIFNPGDRYGYSSGSADTPSINYVANFGIDGPSTSSSLSNSLFFSESSSNPRIFFQGNLRDNNKNGVLDETVATGNRLVSGTYTPLAQRVDLPQVTTTDARGAYIQVLSHAGATKYRDAADRRIVRGAMNQTGAMINSPSQVGGWPTLPTGAPASDANADGIPDWYAQLHGYGTAAADPKINNVVLPSGYTLLETYLHSLTPHAYGPAQTELMTVSSTFGRGGDAYVTENGGSTAASGGNGVGASLDAVWSGSGGANNQAIVLRFDLSQVAPGSVVDASLQLTTTAATTGSRQFKVFALEHDAPDWNWSEDSIEFNGAPGMTFDGNSGTLGLSASSTNIPNILNLGTLTVGSVLAEQTVSFSNANLAVFLNLAAYFQGTQQHGLVTLILEQTTSAGMSSFYSAEGNGALAPRLLLNAMAVSPIMGDANDDGIVNALDSEFVAAHWGETGPLGDVNGDMIVDILDVSLISANWNTGLATAVPEPTSFALLCLGAAASVCFRRQRTCSVAPRIEASR